MLHFLLKTWKSEHFVRLQTKYFSIAGQNMEKKIKNLDEILGERKVTLWRTHFLCP